MKSYLKIPDYVIIFICISISLVFSMLSPLLIAPLLIVLYHLTLNIFVKSSLDKCLGLSLPQLEEIYLKLGKPVYIYKDTDLMIAYGNLLDYDYMVQYVNTSVDYAEIAMKNKQYGDDVYQSNKKLAIDQLESYTRINGIDKKDLNDIKRNIETIRQHI